MSHSFSFLAIFLQFLKQISGACVGSANYKYDLYSNDTTTNLLTDVVSLTLYDPEAGAVLAPGSLTSSLQVQIPLRSEEDAKYFFTVSFCH